MLVEPRLLLFWDDVGSLDAHLVAREAALGRAFCRWRGWDPVLGYFTVRENPVSERRDDGIFEVGYRSKTTARVSGLFLKRSNWGFGAAALGLSTYGRPGRQGSSIHPW
jgi:hypothetical protein